MLGGHYPASSLVRSPPTPDAPASRVIDSPAASGVRPPARRVSRGSSTILSPRAVRSHPGGSPCCVRWLLHRACWLPLLRQLGHPRVVFRGRFRFIPYGSPLRRPALLTPSPRLPCPDRPRSPCFVASTRQAAATCLPAIYMAPTSQAARMARLILAHQRSQRQERNAKFNTLKYL